MSSDKQHGRFVFTCDSCEEVRFKSEPGDDFNAAWEKAKTEGWRARKIGKDWAHFCPDCEP